MCNISCRVPHGVSWEDIAPSMKESKRMLFRALFNMAGQEMREAGTNGTLAKIKPSVKLFTLYNLAIKNGGAVYNEVNAMKEIFDFPPL